MQTIFVKFIDEALNHNNVNGVVTESVKEISNEWYGSVNVT